MAKVCKRVGVPGTILGLLMLAGCGESEPQFPGARGTVKGTVTFAGKPLRPGTGVVLQHREQAHLALGLTDESGAYQVTDFNGKKTPEILVGEYLVCIRPPAPPRKEHEISAEEQLENPDVIEETVAVVDFPEHYLSFESSGLTTNVIEGENVVDFSLEAKKDKGRP